MDRGHLSQGDTQTRRICSSGSFSTSPATSRGSSQIAWANRRRLWKSDLERSVRGWPLSVSESRRPTPTRRRLRTEAPYHLAHPRAGPGVRWSEVRGSRRQSPSGLREGPHLQPFCDARPVGSVGALRHEPPVAPGRDRLPHRETVAVELAGRVDKRLAVHDVFEWLPSIPKWARTQIPPVQVRQSNAMNTGGVAMVCPSGSESRWNRETSPSSKRHTSPSRISVGVARAADALGDFREPSGAIASCTAHQANTRAVLERDDAPAVVFLLVQPAVAVEGLGALGVDQVDGLRGGCAGHREQYRAGVNAFEWRASGPPQRNPTSGATRPSRKAVRRGDGSQHCRKPLQGQARNQAADRCCRDATDSGL
jgi:hypothetical protein